MAVVCFDSPCGSLPLSAGFLPVGLCGRGNLCGMLAHRYLRRGVFPVEFSFIIGRVALVRYRGHAPRMDYLALLLNP